MGGVAKSIGRVATGVFTLGGSEIARKYGGNTVKSTLDKVNMGMGANLMAGAAGGAAISGAAGLGLIGSGPAAGAAGMGGATTAGIGGALSAGTASAPGVLASTGGVPLLTKVLMGASVASTLAGFFGQKSPEDYSSWFDSLTEQDQNAVKALENNLTQLQTNLDTRNAAVQKVIDDFPAVAQQTYEGMKQAGNAFDDATKQVLDKAGNQLAAKFSAQGGFSSGAFNQALADQAYQLAMPRAQNAYDAEMYKAQIPTMQAQLRLNEAEAQRQFQQQMLGMGTEQRYSATQAMLGRQNQQAGVLAGISQQQNAASNQATQNLFGSLGSTLGNMAMMPMYQQLYNPNRLATTQIPTTSMQSFNQGSPTIGQPFNYTNPNRFPSSSKLNLGY